MVTLKINYPATKAERTRWNKLYGLNAFWAGVPYYRRAEAAKFWHALTIAAMNKAKAKAINEPVIITFWWNDNLDLDNHAAMAKMIVDGMKGRIIQDDNKAHVRGIEHYWHDEPYIMIAVREAKKKK